MLGLATHEPNFTIIREEFKPNKPRPCALCGQMGHEIKECQGTARDKKGEVRAGADGKCSHPVPVSTGPVGSRVSGTTWRVQRNPCGPGVKGHVWGSRVMLDLYERVQSSMNGCSPVMAVTGTM